MKSKRELIKQAAEEDLLTFIKLVAPHRVLGKVHEDLCTWWNREDAKSHQLVLLPRDHQKSAMLAYRVAQYITKHPDATVLYISSTSNLAEKQLKFIKDIITSPIYRTYWPEMVNIDEGKREKWTAGEIAVDHPLRKQEGIRDPTIFTAGLTTSITGLHCTVTALDDIVVKENADTKDGRDKVSSQYSLLASIQSAGALEWGVGTRYHPKDLYSNLMELEEDIYNKDGDLVGSEPVYEVFEKTVENIGDGSGEFLWPRQRRKDGKWFGFDRQVLAKKRAQYLDKTQYRAQYYNDPNDPENAIIQVDQFQYYDRKSVSYENGSWYYHDRKLNVYASIDFAFSLRKKADYTAIVVIGIDSKNNIYVLDIDRFKTDKPSEYFKHLIRLHSKWNFNKLRAEVTVGQSAIVKGIKEKIQEEGLFLSIDEYRPNRYEGTKEERMRSILEPKYANLQVWHYKGGSIQTLEEELVLDRPPHDDIKDALASAIQVAVPPSGYQKRKTNVLQFHGRFGGISF